jgi:hypothetical protein
MQQVRVLAGSHECGKVIAGWFARMCESSVAANAGTSSNQATCALPLVEGEQFA